MCLREQHCVVNIRDATPVASVGFTYEKERKSRRQIQLAFQGVKLFFATNRAHRKKEKQGAVGGPRLETPEFNKIMIH